MQYLTRRIILTTSVNSRRPSVHKCLVTPLFWNGFPRQLRRFSS